MNYCGKYISLGYEHNTLFVRDECIGISEGQLEKIFNAGESHKNKAKSVGLVLTFCKKVIE